MNALFIILTVLIVLAAVLLIMVVLLQSGKGSGLASNFVAGNQALGVRQTADILEKVTWSLVSFIIVLSVVASFTMGPRGTGEVDITDRLENVRDNAQPAFPSAPIQQEAPTTESVPETSEE